MANQAVAATNQGNVIGSATNPLVIQVTGVVNVTAGPTDSYLQVTGNAAIDQIQATGSVTLISTGAITNGASPGTANILATGLTITAANGIGTAIKPLLTRVGTLNATNTASGDIEISNTAGTGAALNITGISNTSGGNVVISNAGNPAAGQGITATGPISATGAGTDHVTLNSGSPLTISANVITPGPVVLTAMAETPPVGDNLTVDSGVTVQSTGSSVSLDAGNNIDVQPGSTVEASTTIGIKGGASSAKVVVEGTLIASMATIGVAAATNNKNTFTITPSASTPITVVGGTAAGTNTLDFNADGLPVTIRGDVITAGGDQPVTFSDFAAVNLLNPAGGGSITLDAVAGRNDAMTLTGTGPGAGTFTLNSGTHISFSGVNTFAYNGGNKNEAITVSPFNTPLLQWGVAVTINGGTGTAALIYNNVAGVSENITVQPSAPGAGQLIDTNAATGTSIAVVTYLNTGNIVVSGSNGSTGDTDNLFINGTNGPDIFHVNGTTATEPVVGLTVHYTKFESLQVNGLAGSDTFYVTSSPTVPINIDGGDPVGVVPGDQLIVVTNPGDTATLYPGPTSDSGGFVVNTNQPISFVHIESLGVTGGGTPVVNGTNGNDVISVVATGYQDFTVSVNSGPNLQFVNTPSLKVNGMAGSNQVLLEAPASPNVPWDVAVTVDGGRPSISNQLVVIVPGTSQATYTPAFNGGTLGVVNGGGTVSNVNITNIQSFLYDGQAGGATFTMVGTTGANAFTLTPGAANDAGTLSMDGTLPVTFQNLGTGGQVVVKGNGGADSLVYNGTAANDTFTIANSTSPLVGGQGGQVTLNARVPVLTAKIPTLSLEGLAGNDTFTLVPTIAGDTYTTLNLDGGATASATGNRANLTAAASSPLSISGQTITQGGKTVAGTGLQNINLNGAGNDLTVNDVPDVTEAFNVISSPTARQGQLSIPDVALWSFTNVSVVNVNGNAATNDTLTFTGTNNSDVFQINLDATGTAPVLQLQNATANTLLTLGNYSGFSTLNVYGLDGADTFNVYTGPAVSRDLYINGDIPNGKKKLTNLMNVYYVEPKPEIVHSTATQDPSSGLVSLDYGTATDLITYDGIQDVVIKKE